MDDRPRPADLNLKLLKSPYSNHSINVIAMFNAHDLRTIGTATPKPDGTVILNIENYWSLLPPTGNSAPQSSDISNIVCFGVEGNVE
jgi:hypothetical protein